MLSLNQLCISINENLLVRDISLTLLPNSITYLRGENGSGKTSLLRIIAGIQKPSKGNITIYKNNLPLEDLNKPYCTYIGHKTGIKPELTVYENIYSWAKIFNSTESTLAAIFYFKLAELTDVKCYELSAGQNQRVALARLLACNSSIWLLDEVENNLDTENRYLLNNLIISKANNGGIIIISSNNDATIKSALTINLQDYK